MQKAGVCRPVIFPDKRDVLNCLRTAGITREDYLHALDEI